MRIVDTCNYGSDYPAEKFVLGELPASIAQRIAEALNEKEGPDARRFFTVVPDDYALQPGQEALGEADVSLVAGDSPLEKAATIERMRIVGWCRRTAAAITMVMGTGGEEGTRVLSCAADAIERRDHHRDPP